MKILRVITRLNVGGPAIQAIDLSRELKKKGHEIRLIAGRTPKHEGLKLELKAFNELDVYDTEIAFVPSLKREINLKMDWKVFKNLRRDIKEFKPDILHTHMSKAGLVGRFAALSILKKNRPKIVHTFHGHVFHSYFGKIKTYVIKKIEAFLAKRSNAIIAISEKQRSDLIEIGVPPEKIHVVMLGFDLEPFLKIKEKEYDPEHLDVGFVGRLAPIKNIDFLVKLVISLKRVFPSVTLHVAGSGEEKELEKLEGLGDSVIFYGWLDREKMPGFYEKMDLIVCTSKNEGTPVSLIEAMASSRLVASTMVGGIVDLLPTRGIILIDNFDLPGVNTVDAKVLRFVMGYKAVRFEYINNAREFVKKNYRLERLVMEIERLYEVLIKGEK